jgi:hypothetical protein
VKNHSIVALPLLASLTFGLALAAAPETAPNPEIAAAPATPTPVFTPGFSDLMLMLVQPRHLKLYYAGTQKNWELAAAESRGVRTALRRIAQAIPYYQGNGIDQAVEAIMAPAMQAVDESIAAAATTQFAKAYGDLTAACNGCHAYMEHPFIAIKVPDSTRPILFPDQAFRPSP